MNSKKKKKWNRIFERDLALLTGQVLQSNHQIEVLFSLMTKNCTINLFTLLFPRNLRPFYGLWSLNQG